MKTNQQPQTDDADRSPVPATARSGPARLSRRALVAAGCGLAGGRLLPASAHFSAIQATPTPGRLIVFQSGFPDGSNGVFVANSDGSDARVLVGEPGNGAIHPDWSPDGLQIVYTNEPDGSIRAIAIDGSNPRILVERTEMPTSYDYPAWSPDGAQIAITRYSAGTNGPPAASAIIVLDIESGSITEVVKIAQPNLVDVPRWSPDGTTIVVGVDQFDAAFFEAGAAIATVPASGGELNYLTPFERFAYYPDWHPAGDLIVYTDEIARLAADPSAFGDRWNLYTVTLDGKDAQPISDVAAGVALFQPSWTPEGDRVLATRDSATGRVAVWVDPATGVVTPVGGDIVQTHTRLQPIAAP